MNKHVAGMHNRELTDRELRLVSGGVMAPKQPPIDLGPIIIQCPPKPPTPPGPRVRVGIKF